MFQAGFRGRGAIVLLCSGLASCAAYRTLTLDDASVTEDTAKIDSVRVSAYTTRDGRVHRCDGYMRVAGDSITFVIPARAAHGLEAAQPQDIVTLPRNQVVSVRSVVGTDVPRTVLLLTFATAFVVSVAFVGSMQAWGSSW